MEHEQSKKPALKNPDSQIGVQPGRGAELKSIWNLVPELL